MAGYRSKQSNPNLHFVETQWSTIDSQSGWGVAASHLTDCNALCLKEDGEPLTFAEFMEGMMTLRGSNQTTVKDPIAKQAGD